ncbi:hypothetical protein SYNPS1DRAFT_11662 [Syncephalis pseudoplumigaleata]|uniref:TPR-like protein n=1 Tax=Syncephalis pseudoplumigaleata TaxID=1712513 RepID=A0A4P9Z8Q5_9FUNG|nr:hypothetical protein SYNPS1DRAFT_11662 [Syncephalis pseudoplumigaleata]|eukprot:RKP28130.1 hypothetical protein SYNPS1DRAFT_11662 [Syncephalis pseudoplumigaleata]
MLDGADETIDIAGWIEQRVMGMVAAQPERALQVLVVGVACLNAFFQSGWTGPILPLEPEQLLPAMVQEKVKGQMPRLLQQLSVDSEDVYHLTPRPLYIVYARAILAGLLATSADLPSRDWWMARCLFAQQQLLDNGAGTLHDAIMRHMGDMEARLPSFSSSASAEQPEGLDELQPRYWLERGLVLQWYGDDLQAVDMFKKAQASTGLRWQLSGVLGKRTKFQIDDKSQLVVLAASAPTDEAEEQQQQPKQGMPNTLALNDDTLLETIALAKPSAEDGSQKDGGDDDDPMNPHRQLNLRVIDQCILLAFCLNVKNTNPDHGLTANEMNAYVQRVLQHPNNWMVHTMGLLLRSRLESNKTRTVERSALQLQALIDQIPLDESSNAERLAYIYDILLPSKWSMEKELAERFMSLGVLRSALEIFERLEMWEDVITCHIALGEEAKALRVVERELEKHPQSPKLWCLMGDIKKEPEYYEKAWTLSGERYARAMRSLGGHHFRHEAWRQSLDCYLKALAINPLFENTWFIAGCAALHVEDWVEAERAFRRVVAINHENSEAWSNQASVLIRLGRRSEAYHALKQATRNSYDNWRIWRNFMYACMDVGEPQEAMQALERVVELRADKEGADCVDVELLDQLIVAMMHRADEPVATTGEEAEAERAANKRMQERFERLLRDVITARITNSARIWQTCARFYMWRGDYEACLDAHVKAYRALLHSSACDASAKEFEAVAELAIETADMYRNLGPRTVKVAGDDGNDGAAAERPVAKDWQFQARALLRSLIGRTRDTYAGTPMHDRLVEALADLKQASSE